MMRENGSNLNGGWGKGHLKHCLKTAWGWGRGTAPGSLRTKSIGPEEEKRHRVAYG